MLQEIDKENTIIKNRLILKAGFLTRYFDFMSFLMLILAFPFLSIFSILNSHNGLKENTLGHLIGVLIAFGFSIITILGRLDSRKVIRLKGKSLSDNKDQINRLIKDEKWSSLDSADDVQIIVPGDIKMQITIIYDREDILINVVTFGRGGLISPLRIFKTSALRDSFIKKLLASTFYNTRS
jgi:hypothetical protein